MEKNNGVNENRLWNLLDTQLIDRRERLSPSDSRAVFDLCEERNFKKVGDIETDRRSGGVIVETLGELEGTKFESAIQTLVPELLKECSPVIRRSTVLVRFVDSFESGCGGLNFSADKGEKKYTVVGINKKMLLEHREPDLLGVFAILHELAEADYISKMPKGMVDDTQSIDHTSAETEQQYNLQTREIIANERALKLTRKIWPAVKHPDHTFIN